MKIGDSVLLSLFICWYFIWFPNDFDHTLVVLCVAFVSSLFVLHIFFCWRLWNVVIRARALSLTYFFAWGFGRGEGVVYLISPGRPTDIGLFLCISVLRIASGPRVKLASCKSVLIPPIVHSTDRSKAMLLVSIFFLLFVALCSFVVPALLSVFFFFFFFFFFSICVVMLALWSPSSIAAHFAFYFTSCVFMLAFWSPSTAAHFAFYFISCD